MMKTPIEIYKSFDVVVPFHFTDSKTTKRRPAIVISAQGSFNKKSGYYVLCMITSALHNPWPLDTIIKELKSTGLKKSSIIRMKIFTLDQQLTCEKIGALSIKDQKTMSKNLQSLFGEVLQSFSGS